ncbi:hypothetical protein QZH41_006890 [Actinostola sp. cb2023]|nr:hypothetical protein QZH41_006890 [Actinostola sp. cb2023]
MKLNGDNSDKASVLCGFYDGTYYQNLIEKGRFTRDFGSYQEDIEIDNEAIGIDVKMLFNYWSEKMKDISEKFEKLCNDTSPPQTKKKVKKRRKKKDLETIHDASSDDILLRELAAELMIEQYFKVFTEWKCIALTIRNEEFSQDEEHLIDKFDLKPYQPFIYAVQPYQPFIYTVQPYQPFIYTIQPYQPFIYIIQPYQPFIYTVQPYQPFIYTVQPYQPFIYTPYQPFIYAVQPYQPFIYTVQPYQPFIYTIQPYQPFIYTVQPYHPFIYAVQPYQPFIYTVQPYQPFIYTVQPYQLFIYTIQPYQPFIYTVQPYQPFIYTVQPYQPYQPFICRAQFTFVYFSRCLARRQQDYQLHGEMYGTDRTKQIPDITRESR